jgi:hypothetical protein
MTIKHKQDLIQERTQEMTMFDELKNIRINNCHLISLGKPKAWCVPIRIGRVGDKSSWSTISDDEEREKYFRIGRISGLTKPRE